MVPVRIDDRLDLVYDVVAIGPDGMLDEGGGSGRPVEAVPTEQQDRVPGVHGWAFLRRALPVA